MFTNDLITADVLASQFTENTGSHFLDSGGAYGRNWEKMQGKTTQDFLDAPSVSIDWEYECYSINTFQWLLANLSFDPLMQRRFELITMGSTEPHLVDAEDFAEKMHSDDHYMVGDKPRTFNSYNGETLLDQTIQGVLFARGGDLYIALQIHGGCDVRGGYTAPKIYLIDDSDYFYDETIEFYCNECEWGADLNISEWIDREGCGVIDPWEDSTFDKHKGECPKCGHKLEAEARLSH